MTERLILALNGGSSTFKYALFAQDAALTEQARGEVDDVAAFLRGHERQDEIAAIGHRIVHGGPAHRAPERVTAALLSDLQAAVPLAPDHLPAELRALEACAEALPDVAQFICTDTWFHRTLPRTARLYPLPRRYAEQGVLRFGFHGVSYEWISRRLAEIEPQRRGGRAVVAHLGGGASLCAMRSGESVDTTMGFTPTGGLVMGTRPGDLDPGIVLWLLHQPGMDAEAVGYLLEKESGLRGLAGTADMRKLLSARGSDPEAAEAVDIFCRRAAQGVAAMATSLGGLDCLVFTGGIGGHAGEVRAEIAGRLAWLGLRLDPAANADGAEVISQDSSVTVRVIPTDEERQIALHGQTLLQEPADDRRPDAPP